MTSRESIGLVCGGFGPSKNDDTVSVHAWWKRYIDSIASMQTPELGSRVATTELSDAVIKYLPRDVTLLTASALKARLRKAVSPHVSDSRQIDVIDRNTMRSYISSSMCTGWIDGSGLFSRPFELRKRFATQQYPILFTHHTVSYRNLIWDTFLPLLLSGTKPWDALICSSSASQIQLTTLFEELSISLRRESNVNIQFNGTFHKVPYGVDVNKFQPLDKTVARKKLGLPKRDFIFLFLGRVSPYDKADLFPALLAIQNLVKEHKQKHFRFVIAGGMVKDYRALINSLSRDLGIQDRLLHIPRVPAENLVHLYNCADAFVSPAENAQECFGLAVLEAMSCGIPQIVTDWSGYRDITVNAETGFLIPSMRRGYNEDIEMAVHFNHVDWPQHHFFLAQSTVVDIPQLTSAMLALLVDENTRYRMSKASRKRAEAHFSWEKVVAKYDEILTEKHAILKAVADKERKISAPPTVPISLFSSTRHFSTSLISDAMLFRTCRAPGSESHLSERYSRHFAASDFSYPQSPRKILDTATSVIDFSSLVTETQRIEGVTRPVAELQVAWLVKVGLLERVE